jgi:hypothetical protein
VGSLLLVQAAFQLHGRSSWRRFSDRSLIRARKKFGKSCLGSTSFILVLMRLYMTAVLWTSKSEPAVSGSPLAAALATVANFSEPTKELDALMRSGRIVHDGDPVLAWMLGNVVGHYDAKENAYPRKERPENKIDGAIALIMALGRHMVVKDESNLDNFINNMIMVI